MPTNTAIIAVASMNKPVSSTDKFLDITSVKIKPVSVLNILMKIAERYSIYIFILLIVKKLIINWHYIFKNLINRIFPMRMLN